MPQYSLPPVPPPQHHRLPSILSSPVQTPPLPQQLPQHLPLPNGQLPPQNTKSVPELEGKYNRLKRKYFEMEDRMKDERREKEEAYVHLFRMQQERRAMLDRISELESVPASRHTSSAFPSMLRPADLPPATVSHLRLALDTEDDYDGLPPSKPHYQEHPSEVATKSVPAAEIQFQHVPPPTTTIKRKSKRKAQQTYEQQVSLKEETPTPIVVSSTGSTRLKIKPPAQQPADPAHNGRQESMGPPPIPPPETGEATSPTTPIQPDGDRSNGASTPQSQTRATPTPAPAPRATGQRSTKPKRLKAHTVTAKTFSVPTIPRDPQTAKPVLPLSVGIMTVISLGEICTREHFHTERYIFPVGYEVTRRYLSTTNANTEVTYHCKILEGTGGPIFQIKAPDIDVVEAGSATGAWSGIVKTANGIRSRQHSNSVSGPDYFGLGQNTIKHLIQGLPGADQLRDYVWQKYVEGGPMGGRHAAVVPAVFEDADDGQSGKSPKSDAMDVDVEGDGQEPGTNAGTERGSGSPGQREEERSIPPVPRRSRSENRSESVRSSVGRNVPSSMASLLNHADEGEEIKSTPRAMRDGSEASGSNPSRLSSFKAASVARDISGRPLLPLEIPRASLIKLGEISKRDGYHSSRSIYPIGYELNRVWMSTINPTAEVNYNCQILESLDGPLFQVTAEDRSDLCVRKGDPSEAWAPFLVEATRIRNQDPVSSDRGEEYFGLQNDTIRSLIQELPRARELPKYEWRQILDGS